MLRLEYRNYIFKQLGDDLIASRSQMNEGDYGGMNMDKLLRRASISSFVVVIIGLAITLIFRRLNMSISYIGDGMLLAGLIFYFALHPLDDDFIYEDPENEDF